MLAVGTSAISRVGRSYTQDSKDRAHWTSVVEDGGMPWERSLVLSDDDVLRGEIITELSCNGRLDTEAFSARHGIDFAARFERELGELQGMQDDGLVEIRPGELRLTESGRYLVRNACMVFDAYLPREPSARPRYSSTT
jgi:oxygen-independent coproporphyrinogen-3 oxidase